jgi:hypothetical protein
MIYVRYKIYPNPAVFEWTRVVICFIHRQYKSVETNVTLKFTSVFMQHLATGYLRRMCRISITLLLVKPNGITAAGT